jgi:hypothetical protein
VFGEHAEATNNIDVFGSNATELTWPAAHRRLRRDKIANVAVEFPVLVRLSP